MPFQKSDSQVFRGLNLAGMALGLGLVGFAGAATAETYTCTMKPAGKSHAIPTQLVVTYDPATATAQAFDGIIKHYVGNPIPATLKSKNAKRVLFTWTVPGVKNNSGQYAAGLVYSLNIQLPSGTANMTGKPQGYSNSWRGTGKCTVK